MEYLEYLIAAKTAKCTDEYSGELPYVPVAEGGTADSTSVTADTTLITADST